MLKQRVITAAVLIPVVLLAIFLSDPLLFVILFSLIIAAGAWEWAKLSGLNLVLRYLYSLFVLAILVAIYLFGSHQIYNYIILFGVFYWLVGFLFIFTYQYGFRYFPKMTILRLLIGLMILIPAWSSLVLLKQDSSSGVVFLLMLMLLIWGADSFAYFAGKKWGKNKLAKAISPGKTWEGTIAGLLGGILICVLFLLAVETGITLQWQILIVALITVVMSVFGDLMESLFKREVNIKDSGAILPGHGGILDRIDSLTAAAPAFVFGMIYFGYL